MIFVCSATHKTRVSGGGLVGGGGDYVCAFI